MDKIEFLVLVSDKHITSGRKGKKITYRQLMFQGFCRLISYSYEEKKIVYFV